MTTNNAMSGRTKAAEPASQPCDMEARNKCSKRRRSAAHVARHKSLAADASPSLKTTTRASYCAAKSAANYFPSMCEQSHSGAVLKTTRHELRRNLFVASRMPAASAQHAVSDPYSILGVSRGPPAPTDADIKKAYFKLAKENHPDLNQSPEAEQRFREVAEAYEILKTAYSRHRYEFDGGFAGGFAGGRPGSAGDAQQRGHPYYGAPRWRPRGWENEIFRHVWSELGVQEIANTLLACRSRRAVHLVWLQRATCPLRASLRWTTRRC